MLWSHLRLGWGRNPFLTLMALVTFGCSWWSQFFLGYWSETTLTSLSHGLSIRKLRTGQLALSKLARVYLLTKGIRVVVVVVQSLLCLFLCDPMACSTPGLPVHYQLWEFTQTHVQWFGDAIQLSYLLSSPSPPALNLSQHQGLFQWLGSLHQVAKVLELQLQHQSFQWIFRVDFL